MKQIVVILFVVIPFFASAQDWLPMVRKIFECAPAWTTTGGYSREDAGYEPGTYGAAGGYSGKYGYFRVGEDYERSMHIYYNSEIDYLPGTMFYVGESWTCWHPSFYGRCYSASGTLLYEGKFVEEGGDDFGKPVGRYPNPFYSNKRFEALWDGRNMYLGETVNGVKHGWGLYIWSNGDCLFGEWKNGKKCGFGMRKFSNTCSCIYSENWNDVNYIPKNSDE